MATNDGGGLNFTVDELILPFVPYSTAEHWLVATENEEISLVLSEMIDLYSSMEVKRRKEVDSDNVHNVVYLILKNMMNDDNTVRLQGLRILRLIVEDHAQTLADVCNFFFTACHDLIQDVSRVIRNSALKLLSTLAAKVNFGIISSSVTALLESTYQYHEYCLRACSIAVLHFLVETQLSSIDGQLYALFSDTIIELASSASSIITFSSDQINKHGNKNFDGENYEFFDAKADSSALFSTYEAAIDLFALCTVAICMIEHLSNDQKKSSPTSASPVNRDVSIVRQASSTQTLDILTNKVKDYQISQHHLVANTHHIKFSHSAQNEMIQRIRLLNFPSLSDEVIHELAEKLIGELTEKSNFNSSLKGKSPTKRQNTNLLIDTSVDSTSMSVLTSQDMTVMSAETFESSNPNSLKSARKSLLKSHSSKKQLDLMELTASFESQRGAFSADGGARLLNASPHAENGVPLSARDNNFMSTIDTRTTVEGDETYYPNQSMTPNSNYSRAATVRAKRTKLRTPLKLEVSGSVHDRSMQDMMDPGINLNSTGSLPGFYDGPPTIKNMASLSMSHSSSNDEHDVVEVITARSQASVFSNMGSKSPSRPSRNSSYARSINSAVSSDHQIVSDHPQASVKGSSDGFDYVDTKDIPPLKHPQGDFQKALKALETQDWPDTFYTLNTIRSAVLHHPQTVINSGQLHSFIRLLMKQVENLRSSLAKNALLTMADCFQGLGKQLDAEVSGMVPGLLKRAGDSSIFLSESADRALERMIEHVSTARSLAALLAGLETRSTAQRSKAAYFLYLLSKSNKASEYSLCKEFDAFKVRIVKLLQDSSPESRQSARCMIKELLSQNIFTRQELEFNMNLTCDQIEKIMKEKSHGLATPKGGSYNSIGFRSLDGLESVVAEAGSAANSYRSASPNNFDDDDHSHSSVNEFGKTKTPSRRKRIGSGGGDSSYLKTPPKSAAKHQGYETGFDSPGIADNESFGIVNTPVRKIPPRHHPHAHLPPENNNVEGNMSPGRRQKLPNDSHGNTAQTPRKSPRARNGAGGISASAMSTAKRIMDSDPELTQWQTMQMTIATSKQLNEKKDALSFVCNLILKHHSVLRDVGKLEASLDSILDRFEEGSIKIVLHALELFETILQQEDSILHQCNILQLIAPKLLHAVASTNKQVNQKACQILKSLLLTLSQIQVAQYLTHVSEHDVEKLRLASLKMLMELIPDYCQDSDTLQQVVKKIVFVSVCRNMFTDSAKVEIRLASSEILKLIQSQLKGIEKVWKWTESPFQQDEIKRITSMIS